jgi:hypothetical protein
MTISRTHSLNPTKHEYKIRRQGILFPISKICTVSLCFVKKNRRFITSFKLSSISFKLATDNMYNFNMAGHDSVDVSLTASLLVHILPKIPLNTGITENITEIVDKITEITSVYVRLLVS